MDGCKSERKQHIVGGAVRPWRIWHLALRSWKAGFSVRSIQPKQPSTRSKETSSWSSPHADDARGGSRPGLAVRRNARWTAACENTRSISAGEVTSARAPPARLPRLPEWPYFKLHCWASTGHGDWEASARRAQRGTDRDGTIDGGL